MLGSGTFNGNSKTWWFEANLNASKYGCNPACVVSEVTKTAEINWRCTGLITPKVTVTPELEIKNFEDCVSAGNAVMKSYPRQCQANGVTYVEEIVKEENVNNETLCNSEQRQADVCAEIYQPVCAVVEIQCIKAPCDPVSQTFGNKCEACKNPLVKSYVNGECK